MEGGRAESPRRRIVASTLPVDLDLTLGALVRGRHDPTTRQAPDGAWWRAMRTPEGPATLRLNGRGVGLTAEAWGPGAGWALDAAADLVGAADSLDGFQPAGVVQAIHRAHPGLRMPRARPLLQCLILPVLEQRVPGKQAWIAYYALLRLLGEPAPGPSGLLLPPSAEALAALPSYRLRPLGVDERRATTLVRAARAAARLERAALRPPDEARRVLETIPGIGPWTSAEVARVSLGDADAVSVGDYNLPRVVAWNLAGEDAADDDRMLELLEPYRGHRGRVQRLLDLGGRPLPRRGPRPTIGPFW